MITYSDEIENTKFICKRCQPIKLIPAQLPTKNEYRELHECMICNVKSKVGVLTYCSRCEKGEFVCPNDLQRWFDKIISDDSDVNTFWDDDNDNVFDVDYNDGMMLHEKIITCIHVRDGYVKRYLLDGKFDIPNMAVCDECKYDLENIETFDIDINKNFIEIDSSELKK